MIQTVYKLTQSNAKVIEAVIRDDNLHYMHVSLPAGDRVPVHTTNAIVYMTVAAGVLTIALDDQPPEVYAAGSILKIPKGIVMDAYNNGIEKLQLLVVKAPPPQ